jgi:hypothetical protein
MTRSILDAPFLELAYYVGEAALEGSLRKLLPRRGLDAFSLQCTHGARGQASCPPPGVRLPTARDVAPQT